MTPEARAARERKQKIFVVVGGLVLVAMLAIQLPKLLGGSSSPEAAPATETTAFAAPTAASPVVLASATPAAATTAKLTSFTVFVPKDPFVQQVETQSTPVSAAGTTSGASKADEAGASSKEFSTGATAAAVTIVTVNGSRQQLEPGMKFPAADPLFVLVAEKPGSKSVVVGVVGGAYSGGGKTATLTIGKPMTLVNTTTGARYKISLVSVGSGEAAQ